MNKTSKEKLFDQWPEKYDRWFETPIGVLVKKYETNFSWTFCSPAGRNDPGCRLRNGGFYF